jgi:drug/metabolite transporter (DMT)-like permease
VTLGLFVLDERLGVASVVGLVLILGGSWLATGGRPSQLRRRATVAVAPSEAAP